MRNAKGQFLPSFIKSEEEMQKFKDSLKLSWKERDNYIGDIKHPKIYNCWRSFKFTVKGKKIGNSKEWDDYRTFYNDMFESYFENASLIRVDKSLPFSKENCIWVLKENQNKLNENLIRLEFNGKNYTLLEASLLPEAKNTTFRAIKTKYYNKEKFNYTDEEIITGTLKHNRERRTKGKSKITTSSYELDYQKVKDKASKMVSSYRIKDLKKGHDFDLDSKWLIENILYKECVYCGTKDKIGCDRIDNDKGHTKNNVLPCCIECNTVRNNNFSVEEMKLLGDTIKLIKLNRLK